MVDWSFDDTSPETRTSSSGRRRNTSRSNRRRVSRRVASKDTAMTESRVQKVVNGQVMYLRVRRVVRA
jgi:hypothetical protein